MRSTFVCLVLTCLLVLVAGWTKEDHEIFQLRDEIEVAEGAGTTFYDFLKVKPSASHEDISKAFRARSREMHPDKAKNRFISGRLSAKSKDGKPKVNKRPSDREIKAVVKEAQQRYARLSVVKGLLSGEGRGRYDHFLKNGFPTWRSTGYYYNRYRPGLVVTLAGLWLFAGGLVHYGVLVMGYKQHRKFLENMIKHARKEAFGDDSSIAGIPGIDTLGETAAVPTPPPAAESDEQAQPEPRNRKERRAMEKQMAKEGKASKGPVSQKKAAAKAADKAVANAPPVQRRRIMAQNGRVLLVAQTGEVWFEEEDNDGNTEEVLIDPEFIERPSFRQTAVFRAPVWAFKVLKKRITGQASEEEEQEIEELSPDHAAEEIKDVVEASNGGAISAAKKKSKAKKKD